MQILMVRLRVKLMVRLMVGLMLLTLAAGCASSSDLDKSAQKHIKSGNYYQSIGQPQAAREEYSEADKDFDQAGDVFSILVDLFNHFSKDD